jgi:PAS domain S-box-containing protein
MTEKTIDELKEELLQLTIVHKSLMESVEQKNNIKEDEDKIFIKLIQASEEFIQFTGLTPDYKKILQVILNISGAKYAVLNIFDENGLDFTTIDVVGINENIAKGLSFLGFNIHNKHWTHDPFREEKTKEQLITRFLHLNELTGDTVPKSIIYLIEKTFNIQETVIVKIIKENRILGDFTLLFEKGDTLLNMSFVKLYASQVGLFLERQKATALLTRNEENYRLMISGISDVIGIIGKTGFIKYVSPNSEKWFGWTPKELEGTDSWLMVHPEDLKRVKLEFYGSLQNKFTTHRSDFRYRCKDGNYKFIEMNATNNLSDSGIDGILLNYHDITNRWQMEQEIIESEKRLVELNANKDLFLSIISHDLKGPLNNIMGLSEVLIEDLGNREIEQAEEIAKNILRSSGSTISLLEDLLMWARTQQNKVPFRPLNQMVAEIISNILELLKPMANAKNITVKYFTPENMIVFADSDMLKTVLRNLVSNAIKFTNKGGEISIKAEENSDCATITVSDNGIGISPANRSRLFDISKVHTTKGTEKETGTGIGLLLCQDFIEKHGGKIHVKSEQGMGSDFIFTLPLSA